MKNKKIFVVMGYHNLEECFITPMLIGVYDTLEKATEAREETFKVYKKYYDLEDYEIVYGDDECTSHLQDKLEEFYVFLEIIETYSNKFINYELE